MMTWIDNIYQKFENMIQEVEDTMLEKFQDLENQMSIAGESVKKLYSTAMEDLLSPSTTSALVLPIGHYAGISEKSLQRVKKLSGTNLDHCYYVKADNFKSGVKPQVESADVESNIGSNVNQLNEEMPTSETAIEPTVAKTDSAEVTDFASVSDFCNRIENASTEQNRGVVEVLVDSAEEKEENMSSFSSDIFEDATGFSMINAMQQDDDSKLDQTCVLILKDELQFAPKATVNRKTIEKKWLQPFSLIKKSARKKESEELALLHGKNEIGNDNCIESLCREDIFEPEWELL
ncbi:uncharacterized protein LOC131648168 isoform X1 [Vicia villosa]|uniref:uncharacterized protein LOC131648168 isoform X1 n=2 Tax=Vicia villosa TaxID=3911 RepID=UPI00273C7A11|nr:uncharacterized protein LOC131648168 isoform X1 [Vicia villosa]